MSSLYKLKFGCIGILVVYSLRIVFAAPGGALSFSDIAEQAGLRANMRCGTPEKRWIPEANGSGAAWLDYDNDGFEDLLIVNGGTMEQLRMIAAGQVPEADHAGLYLYHNLGNGRFEDVTASAGLKNEFWGTGANAADFNRAGTRGFLRNLSREDNLAL